MVSFGSGTPELRFCALTSVPQLMTPALSLDAVAFDILLEQTFVQGALAVAV